MNAFNSRKWQKEIHARNEFHNSTKSFRGEILTWPDGYNNLCPHVELTKHYRRLFENDDKVYVIFSYWTPIYAVNLRTGEHWENGNKYSVTTTKHQHCVRMGFNDKYQALI